MFLKKIVPSITVAFLIACSGESVTQKNYELPSEVADLDELESFECNDIIIGDKIYVTDLKVNYECDGSHWFDSKDSEPPKAFSSSSAKSSSSHNDKCIVVKPSSSSVALAVPCRDMSEGNCYGSITDKRDNQTYKVVKIGEQWWMAENLNYQTENSFCYNDSTQYCDKYGRLYTWSAAMDSAKTGCSYGSMCCIDYPVRGICPEGWHIPSMDESIILEEAVGGLSGDRLKGGGWHYENGTSGSGYNSFYFNVLPAGERSINGEYSRERQNTSFWSATERKMDTVYCMGFGYNYAGRYMYPASSCNKRMGYSIRCTKDDAQSTAGITFSSSSVKSSSSISIESRYSSSSIDFSSSSEERPSSSSAFSSSSEEAFSSSSETDVSSSSEYTPIYGEDFLDTRDNRTYKTLIIGNQIWMAEDLKYAPDTGNAAIGKHSWCYDDNDEYCEKYGRLYDWTAAVDTLESDCGNNNGCDPLEEPRRGICPEGWHIPNTQEVDDMIQYLSETGINHILGFNAQLSGYRNIKGQTGSMSFGEKVIYWTVEQHATSGYGARYAQSFTFAENRIYIDDDFKFDARSVRCLMARPSP